MESLALSQAKHVNMSDMKDKGTRTEDDSLATTYLIYAESSANVKYIRIVKDANATVINVANEILNNVFIVNPLITTYPKIGSIGLVKQLV